MTHNTGTAGERLSDLVLAAFKDFICKTKEYFTEYIIIIYKFRLSKYLSLMSMWHFLQVRVILSVSVEPIKLSVFVWMLLG